MPKKKILISLGILIAAGLISIPATKSIVGSGNDPLATGYIMENWNGPLPVDPPWYLIHGKTDRIGGDAAQVWHTTLYTFFGIPYKIYEYSGPGTAREINPFF